jgi:malonyl-CoA O-methyltransferase
MQHSFANIEKDTDEKRETLFLPGWGFDGNILALIKPLPPWIFPKQMVDPDCLVEDILCLLTRESINPVRVIGWSMGARLALDLARMIPERISSLTLISARHHWPLEETSQLSREFSDNPVSFLKTFYRKCFLGDKHCYKDFTRNIEPQYISTLDKDIIDRLQRGLDYLSRSDCHAVPEVPTQLIQGRQDIIAPVSEMARLPNTAVEIVDNGGHMVFLNPGCSIGVELKKEVIEKKFSRAASTYDRYALVQKDAAHKLAARLLPEDPPKKIKNILEIGCGTGNFTTLLADTYQGASIEALDFSSEMLQMARRKLSKNSIRFICQEAENFLDSCADDSYDMVASNGALQWFSDHEGSLKNIARILRPGGVFLCSIFGPDSLKKLGRGLKVLFEYSGNVAADAFPDLNTLQQSLNAYFSAGTIEQELIEKEYGSVRDLLVHIKKTGTGGWQQHGSPTLTPTRLELLDRWFNATYGGCKVTYQILYLQAIK